MTIDNNLETGDRDIIDNDNEHDDTVEICIENNINEALTEQLHQLILKYLQEYSDNDSYFYKEPDKNEHQLDFHSTVQNVKSALSLVNSTSSHSLNYKITLKPITNIVQNEASHSIIRESNEDSFGEENYSPLESIISRRSNPKGSILKTENAIEVKSDQSKPSSDKNLSFMEPDENRAIKLIKINSLKSETSDNNQDQSNISRKNVAKMTKIKTFVKPSLKVTFSPDKVLINSNTFMEKTLQSSNKNNPVVVDSIDDSLSEIESDFSAARQKYTPSTVKKNSWVAKQVPKSSSKKPKHLSTFHESHSRSQTKYNLHATASKTMKKYDNEQQLFSMMGEYTKDYEI